MPPNRAFPIVFKMVHPVPRLYQRRPAACDRIGETHPVRCPAILDLLRQACLLEARRLVRSADSIDREYLDRLDDVFQFLRTQVPETESKLSLDLIIDLAGNEDAARLCDASSRAAMLMPSP